MAERFEQSSAAVASDVVEFAQDLLRRNVLATSDMPGAGGQAPSRSQSASEAAFGAFDAKLDQAPAVQWEERLEESGVYAAGAKDPFLGPNPEQCSQVPPDFAS